MKFTIETLIRAARTFLQSALSYMLVSLAAVDFTEEKSALKTILLGLCVSSIASGFAAVMNLEKRDDLDDV